MKSTDRYYKKIYRQTSRLTRKLFGKNIVEVMSERFSLKKKIEQVIEKSIDDITCDDIRMNKLGYSYARYLTICKILEVLENACTLKTFTIEEYENECI